VFVLYSFGAVFISVCENGVNKKEVVRMKISRYKLNQLIRYYELKDAGHEVLAGILRTSELGDIDLQKVEEAVRNNELEIVETCGVNKKGVIENDK